MTEPAPTFYALFTYRDLNSDYHQRYVYETTDLGDAILYIESVFRRGYLTIRAGNRYRFIPTACFLEVEAY